MPNRDRETAFDLAAGNVPRYCAVCRGPRADLPHLIQLSSRDEIGECPACGRVTCPDGRSARRVTGEGVMGGPFFFYEGEKPVVILVPEPERRKGNG